MTKVAAAIDTTGQTLEMISFLYEAPAKELKELQNQSEMVLDVNDAKALTYLHDNTLVFIPYGHKQITPAAQTLLQKQLQAQGVSVSAVRNPVAEKQQEVKARQVALGGNSFFNSATAAVPLPQDLEQATKEMQKIVGAMAPVQQQAVQQRRVSGVAGALSKFGLGRRRAVQQPQPSTPQEPAAPEGPRRGF